MAFNALSHEHIAIVGAGQSGASLAARLRSKGFDGPISLFGDEPHPPYQRPPLSKKYLSGEWEADRLHLRSASYWSDIGVDLVPGVAVEAVDTTSRTLIAGGRPIGWDKLALTTGARPRPLPATFPKLAGVHELRNIADVEALRAVFLPGRSLVVIGGGFIGLETAAVAAKAGLAVTVVELASRILERVVCPQTADIFRALHQGHGVRIVEGCGVSRLVGNVTLTAVELVNGEMLEADLALVGIGVVPETRLADAAGIATANGVLVDAYGRTSAAGVWAAGDCATFVFEGQPTRLESVQNAVDQAEAVADDMLGVGEPYRPVPWFWSDQYDVKLQIAGLNRGYTEIVVRDGGRGRSNWYFRDGRLIAVDAVNDARSFMTGRKLLELGIEARADLLRDPGFDPRSLLP